MASDQQLQDLYAATVVTRDGDKIGSVEQVYLDDATSEPEWVTVKTGLFGSAESFVPLAAATVTGEQVQVPYSKDQVKDAPRVEADADLSPEQEDELYRHYGLTSTAGRVDEDVVGTTGTATTGVADTTTAGVSGGVERGEGHDTSGPNTDDAMTRSEEQLHVGTRRTEAGRARLRKHVVTETQTRTVPVSHEELRVEREPITEANRDAALSGGDLTEEEHEVTLTAERAVVEKETVPVERVRLGTEEVTEEERVSAEVRREEIELDADDTVRGRGDR